MANMADLATTIIQKYDRDLEAGTITPDTFYVSQGSGRIAGAIDYMKLSKMAVFYPARPLRPNTTYTATMTTGIRDLAGAPPLTRLDPKRRTGLLPWPRPLAGPLRQRSPILR